MEKRQVKATGIISEYNPFHEGHRYQIRKAREKTGADVVVVVMNGDFVQRGECAVTDKYVRTKMALLGGADYVFELPVRYGISSAADFAYGGILALDSLGCVDAVCFGCEAPEDIDTIADIFWKCQREPEGIAQMKQYLAQGLSYPAARQHFLQEKTGWSEEKCRERMQPGNILGAEYRQAIRLLGSSMECVPILREGMGYHQIEPEAENDWKYMSATAIRAQMEAGLDCVKGMPEEALRVWKEAGYSMKTEDFWPALALAVRMHIENLDSYKDVSEDLAAVFSREILQAVDYESFIHACKTKNITMARVKRALFQILFEVKKEGRETKMPYLRLLGRRKDACPLPLGSSRTTVIGRLAKEEERLSESAGKKLAQDIFAADIYHMTAALKTGMPQKNEYKQPMVIVG